MSAGQQKEHYMQDAGEIYFTYKCQEYLEVNNINICTTSSEIYKEFLSYLDERGLSLQDFEKTEYCNNIDYCVPEMVSRTYEKYGKKFDAYCDERDARNNSKKRDIVFSFEDGTVIPCSLKNYQNGIRGTIQVCSGTWVSFLNNIILESAPKVGQSINPVDNKPFFPGRSKEKRQKAFEKLGYKTLNDLVDNLENIKNDMRDFYISAAEAEYWENIAERWKQDCASFGTNAAKEIALELRKEEYHDLVKQRLVKMIGFDGEEELILLGKKEYLCSFLSPSYEELAKKVRSQKSKIKVLSKSQNLVIQFYADDEEKSFLDIDIPFTLQKNGAWHLPTEPYEGEQFHKKEGKSLKYGQRRPKKSKEINTSINTYFSLVKCGVI